MRAYQATFALPHTVLGISCDNEVVIGIDFLPATTLVTEPGNPIAALAVEQLTYYLRDPAFVFDLPLQPKGTLHQNKVWRAMLAIPAGRVRTYGDVARELGSSPRAVGQACGANPIPVVIPCHRIVGTAGFGGFMHSRAPAELSIKTWLLAHEQSQARAA